MAAGLRGVSRVRAVMARSWPPFAALGGLVLVWWGVSATGFFDPAILPSPARVGETLVRKLWELRPGSADGGIALALQKSVVRLAFGMAVSVVIGTLLGLAMGVSGPVRRSLGSLMTGLQALPSISWLPLAILWFGLNERAILFVVIIAAIPAVALATSASVRLVPPLLVRAGRTLGATGAGLYRHVILPAAVPGYVGGLQLAWAFAWRALMAGELIATGARGLGHLQDLGRQTFDAPLVMAIMVVIVLIGMIVDAIFGVVDRRVRLRRGLVLDAEA